MSYDRLSLSLTTMIDINSNLPLQKGFRWNVLDHAYSARGRPSAILRLGSWSYMVMGVPSIDGVVACKLDTVAAFARGISQSE